MTKLLPLVALTAVFSMGMQFAPSASGVLPGAAMAQDAEAPAIVEMVQGSEDATVEIIEYASFTCPHCASFHANQYEEIKANYIDTGLVRFVYREVYFDRFGLWASMVARCGGEERFFGIADMLYAQQSEWLAGGQDPALIADNLRRIGLTAGIDAEQMDACMADGAQAQALVGWYEANAEADDVRGTPSFLINGEKYSNMNYEDFAAVLDAELGQ